jgi:hypothetical protein
MDAHDTRRFFFVHIPKTGGTSFRHMLYELFPPEHVLANEADIHANGGRYINVEQLQRVAPERLATCRLLVGHLPLAAAARLGTAPQILVLLRDPIARAVSNLRHSQRVKHIDLSLKDVLDVPGELTKAATNPQTRMLSFESFDEAVAECHTLKPDRARLERAKQNLAECAFVGLTERFRESVVLCERTFGWEFPTGVLTENISPPMNDDLKDVLPRVQEECQLDSELYAFAQELFAARLASA